MIVLRINKTECAARAELLRNMMSLGTRPAPAAIGNLVWSRT